MNKPFGKTPQQLAHEVLQAFPRGERASAQQTWRMIVAGYVQAAFGRKSAQHGLPRDLEPVLDLALETCRQVLAMPDFVPLTWRS
jgi:hypothetical protein